MKENPTIEITGVRTPCGRLLDTAAVTTVVIGVKVRQVAGIARALLAEKVKLTAVPIGSAL